MITVWSALAWIVALPVLVLTWLLCTEFIAALLPTRPVRQERNGTRPRVAILVPAHDESSVIGPTLDSLRPQLASGDSLTVIADNCSDDTRAVATAHGATTVERCDAERTGKGYALDWGMRYLQSNPPEVVVIIDADTPAQPGAIDALAYLACVTQRPAQAAHVPLLPLCSPGYQRIRLFALLVKNYVRPAGLARLGLPCVLTGTGMAFPWSLIRQADVATGALAEDLLLTAQLARRGYAPRFCAEARIDVILPQSKTAVATQTTRWEHGHLQVLVSEVPLLAISAIGQRRLDIVGLALEMAVPPLSLLALAWLGSIAVTALVGHAGATWAPAVLLAVSAMLASLGALAAWVRWGRAMLPLRSALGLPRFVLSKVPLYVAFVTHRQTAWVRTQRDHDHSEDAPSAPESRSPEESASR